MTQVKDNKFYFFIRAECVLTFHQSTHMTPLSINVPSDIKLLILSKKAFIKIINVVFPSVLRVVTEMQSAGCLWPVLQREQLCLYMTESST